jgi:lactoylglutathione lyase
MVANLSVIGLDHYAIAVSDVTESLHFYRDILGLKVIERPAFDFAGAWLDVGNGLSLHLIEDKTLKSIKFSGSRKLHFAFAVSDIYRFKAYLEDQGFYIIKDIKPRPDGVLQLFVHDPDGYFVEIVEDGIKAKNETRS